ncbi:glycoside hydrolase family 32 protein [Yersinia frederiksenii]|uniref:glycoside hydrolase family 32 protein n=1 Tax=Yersinia frederiksenii TaxID=29484 RepID=UPI0005DD4336|nr:glycoside hydrolase family 32 protein [Yersinia frederiksenii]CNF35363.1 Sucrose-6-phosphate hydrolase [Yersinia frederiksenii]
MNSLIEQANDALQTLASQMNPRFYPHFHLAPPAGWMNDPNGLIFYHGLYHAFYQHHPYDENWGPMHWGHATSQDMLSWQHQPIALAPGDSWDKDGCFSGCAVDDNGVLSLIYTGHVWLKGEGDDSAIREVQCLATSQDGIHFTKQGVVLTPPEGIMHFRDPKVWFEDGYWWMVVGARDAQDHGQVLLYRASSLRQWQFIQVLARADDGMGYMWECPDFFPMGNERMLMFSPQGLTAKGYRNRNLFQSGVLRGKWQPGADFTPSQPFTELDHGHDFYAPQSLLTPDGRRVIIGWMDMWQSPMPTKADNWCGCLSLPRELSLDPQGLLLMQPVREVETLRQTAQPIAPMTKGQPRQFLAENCRSMELQLKWDCATSDAERYGFQLGEGQGNGGRVSVYMDNQANRLILERHYPQHDLTGYRSVSLPESGLLSLRVFIDSSSLEVFINDGQACMSSRIYPAEHERCLSLFAENGQAQLLEGKFWRLGTHLHHEIAF